MFLTEGCAVVIQAEEEQTPKRIYKKQVPQLYPIDLGYIYPVSADRVKEMSYAYLMSCSAEVKKKWVYQTNVLKNEYR